MSDFFTSEKFNPREFDKCVKKRQANNLLRLGVFRENAELYEHFSPSTGKNYAMLKDGRGVPIIVRARALIKDNSVNDVDCIGAVANYVISEMNAIYLQVLISILNGIYDSNSLPLSKTDIVEDINDIMTNTNYNKYAVVLIPTIMCVELRSYQGKAFLLYDSSVVHVDGFYTIYLLGRQAFDYADIGAKVPYAIGRNSAINKGCEMFYIRQRKCFVPYGFSYTKAKQQLLSPSDEELADGNNWTLIDGINIDDIPIHRVLCKA